jgi:hypothetical protein
MRLALARALFVKVRKVRMRGLVLNINIARPAAVGRTNQSQLVDQLYFESDSFILL